MLRRNDILKVLAIFIILYTPSNAYRILGIFPFPVPSHFQFFHPVLRGLAEAGHELTILSHFPDKNLPINYKNEVFPAEVPISNFSLASEWLANRIFYGHMSDILMISNWGHQSCIEAYNSDILKHVLNSDEKYDVILMELFNSDCVLGVAWKLQVPVIGLSSSGLLPWYPDHIRTPHIDSFMPSLFLHFNEKMDFAQRLYNFVDNGLIKLYNKFFMNPYIDELLQNVFGKDVPAIRDLKKQISLVFVNQHYSLSGAKPLSPDVIELGGIHIGELKPLESKLKAFLDEATEGVVYVCWGSLLDMSSMPKEKRESLVKVFGTLKQKVLWKWEKDDLENKPNNVYIHKWLPQKEILCHPNVRVFWTHGGNSGAMEAINCEVAVIATPIYGDQSLNGAAFENRKIGTILRYDNISVETVHAAISLALHPDTQAAVKKVSYSFRNRIQTPKETANWWVEHVIRSGGSPLLKSHAVHLPGYIYHSFDVYAVLVLGLVVFIISVLWIIKMCFRRTKREKLKTK